MKNSTYFIIVFFIIIIEIIIILSVSLILFYKFDKLEHEIYQYNKPTIDNILPPMNSNTKTELTNSTP